MLLLFHACSMIRTKWGRHKILLKLTVESFLNRLWDQSDPLKIAFVRLPHWLDTNLLMQEVAKFSLNVPILLNCLHGIIQILGEYATKPFIPVYRTSWWIQLNLSWCLQSSQNDTNSIVTKEPPSCVPARMQEHLKLHWIINFLSAAKTF